MPTIVLPAILVLVTSETSTELENKAKLVTPILATIVSLAALTLSITTLIFGRSDRSKDAAKAVNDGFWLQKVLLPAFVEPLRQFLDKQETEFLKDPQKFDIDDFSSNILLLRSRVKLFYKYDENLPEKLDRIFDELETYVTIEHAKANGQDISGLSNESTLDFTLSASRIFEILNKLHSDLISPK